jgi:hypothetical protein
MHMPTRRIITVGVIAAAGAVAAALGVNAAHADTMPPPPPSTINQVFTGVGNDTTEAGAKMKATDQANADEAMFVKDSGAMCTNDKTTVESQKYGDQFVAVAHVFATCTLPMPTPPPTPTPPMPSPPMPSPTMG